MPVCIALDFETSDYAAESACAIGLARVRIPETDAVKSPADAPVQDSVQGSVQGIDGTFYSLIRPPSSRVRFSEIHGLTWPMLKNAPSFAEIWPDMAAFMAGASFLVAHNAPFDRKVLYACCAKAGVAAPAAPFLCTLKGSRRALHLPSHTLGAVCAHCAIPLNHHHAGSDALAAANILLHLLDLGINLDAMLSGSRPQGPLRRHGVTS